MEGMVAAQVIDIPKALQDLVRVAHRELGPLLARKRP